MTKISFGKAFYISRNVMIWAAVPPSAPKPNEVVIDSNKKNKDNVDMTCYELFCVPILF